MTQKDDAQKNIAGYEWDEVNKKLVPFAGPCSDCFAPRCAIYKEKDKWYCFDCFQKITGGLDV